MPEPKSPKPDDPAEYERFVEIARSLAVEEDEGALDRAFEKIISPPPSKKDGGKKAHPQMGR